MKLRLADSSSPSNSNEVTPLIGGRPVQLLQTGPIGQISLILQRGEPIRTESSCDVYFGSGPRAVWNESKHSIDPLKHNQI